MKIREILDVVATLLVLGVAVATVGSRFTEGKAKGPEDIRDWKEVNTTGLRIGPVDSSVEITEFLDVQCPYCSEAWEKVLAVLEDFPEDVSIVLHHYPLDDLHAHATPGAIALECSSRQGKVRPFLDAVFEEQDSLGTKAWVEFAKDAGIPDLVLFRSCVGLPVDSFPRIAHGLELKERYRITGTPSLFVNGEHVSRSRLAEDVRKALGEKR